jgi:aconitate hydratase
MNPRIDLFIAPARLLRFLLPLGNKRGNFFVGILVGTVLVVMGFILLIPVTVKSDAGSFHLEQNSMNNAELRSFYQEAERRINAYRAVVNRPLTLVEKVLVANQTEFNGGQLAQEQELKPGFIGLQDATAQMALLQFMQAGFERFAVQTAVFCDHLSIARDGAEADLATANTDNQEVYDFLRSVSQKYGAHFHEPNNGIIHAIILFSYALPLVLGLTTDSHGPNAGAVGPVIGVGGAEAVDPMVGLPFTLGNPKKLGVRLEGELPEWAAPKDVILELLNRLTTKGGTGYVAEYFGAGLASLTVPQRATFCNMGAELGLTTSICGYDQNTATFLRDVGRGEAADICDDFVSLLSSDVDVYENAELYFDKVETIDLSKLVPTIAGPNTPDLVRNLPTLAASQDEIPPLSAVCIGSCTHSGLGDMKIVADILQQGLDNGIKPVVPVFVFPGSSDIRRAMDDMGITATLEAAGVIIGMNSCGACIGSWDRGDVTDANSVVSTFNRPFVKRFDGSVLTQPFVTSPAIAAATALGGFVGFNPEIDELQGINGTFKLQAPTGTNFSVPEGFVASELPDSSHNPNQEVIVNSNSERLELLVPFAPWDGEDFVEILVLMKTQGKNTTDHISQAGKWLFYRGHLTNISKNYCLGSTNAFTGKAGVVEVNGQEMKPWEGGLALGSWCIVGDQNDGEGSSREHAAMEQRQLGGLFKLVRSYARLHLANLKKQGILPLTFVDPADYDLIRAGDKISVSGLASMTPEVALSAVIHHDDGTHDVIVVNHNLTEVEIAWFRSGSSLNWIRENIA